MIDDLENGVDTSMGLSRLEVGDFGMKEEMLEMKLKVLATMVVKGTDMIFLVILLTPSPTI